MAEANEDLRKLVQSLNGVKTLFIPYAKKAVDLCLVKAQEVWGEYPEQPSRTRAKTFNTYVRGVGQYPRSAFTADPKKPGGFKVGKVKIGSIRRTSEQLGSRFVIEVHGLTDGAEGTISNTASYADAVIGDAQTPYHKETGWETPDEVMQEIDSYIDQVKDQTIDEFISDFVAK